MPHVISADGTLIGFDPPETAGPLVVLVSGALDDGRELLPLRHRLESACAVATYRRRGRGDSGDTQPVAVQREIEDLAAVVAEVGGPALVFGASTGGALVLEAAAAGLPVERIAVHEIPYPTDAALVSAWHTYTAELSTALEACDRDEALRLFMRFAGASDEDITLAEAAPVWPVLRELAPTLRHDAACLGEGPPPVERLARVVPPVLLTTGATIDPHLAGLPADFFTAAAEATAVALPHARRVTLGLPGHVPDPDLLGPLLLSFVAE